MHKYFKKCNYKGKKMLETAQVAQNVPPYIEGSTLFWGLIVVLVIMLAIFDSFYRNLKGETLIITDWSGRVVKIISGNRWCFKKPFIEYREVVTGGIPEVISLSDFSIITRDDRGITYPNIDILLYKVYNKTKTGISSLAEGSRSNSSNNKIIINFVTSSIKDIVSKYHSNEINKKQPEIEKKIMNLLNKEFKGGSKFLTIKAVMISRCVHKGKKYYLECSGS
jgi:hypothetical protein